MSGAREKAVHASFYGASEQRHRRQLRVRVGGWGGVGSGGINLMPETLGRA